MNVFGTDITFTLTCFCLIFSHRCWPHKAYHSIRVYLCYLRYSVSDTVVNAVFMILTGLPNMDSKDVEEIFKGVLTDESQESQESVFPLAAVGTGTSTPVHASVPQSAGMVSPSGSVTHSGNSLTAFSVLWEMFLSAGLLHNAFEIWRISWVRGDQVCTVVFPLVDSFHQILCLSYL